MFNGLYSIYNLLLNLAHDKYANEQRYLTLYILNILKKSTRKYLSVGYKVDP